MSTMISRTQTAGTNPKKLTVSFWMKATTLGTNQGIWGCGTGAGDAVSLHFQSADRFSLETYDGSANPKLLVNRKLRDPAAWYHIVCSIDTTNTTSTDRLKLYVNGERLTDIQQYTTITQDSDIPGWSGSGDTLKIGNRILDGDAYFKGLLTHFHVIDGTIYTPTDFAETDSVSGIWKPKTAPSLSYGANGGFYKFENSAAMGTDSSGQSNNCSVSGTLTQNVDTPSNNYNTLNSIAYSTTGVTLSNGNTSFNSGSGVQYAFGIPSFALNKGKWYFESKIGHTCAGLYIGDTNQVVEAVRNSTRIGVGSQQYSWECNGNFQNNNSQTSYGSSAAAGNIIGMFVDLDNNKLYISINGTIQNSGTGFSITDPNSTETGFYYVGGIADQCGATANVTADMNYGGGYFGTTAVSSAQADANGEGVFEYSPNQGGASNFDSAAKNFYALNTKNIKEFG